MKNIITTIFTILLIQSTTHAQPGAIDLTFNSIDVGFRTDDDANGIIWTNSIQNDGKIIIGGAFTTYNGTARNRITRLNSDGTVDQDFNVGIGTSSVVYSSSIQSDGKILIAGDITYNGIANNRIARLNTDGSIDNNFNIGGGANSTIYSISIQNDGKIIIAGSFTTFNGVSRKGIARLNIDGTLDTSFNPGTGINSNSLIRTTCIQSDGKIIIGGSFTSYNGSTINRLARINIDGTIDTNFNTGTGTNNDVLTLSIQNDGKLIIGGKFNIYNGIVNNFIARINFDGSLDTSFNSGTGLNNFIYSIFIQNDGRIIIGGDFTAYNGVARNRIARINNNGNLDLSFIPGNAVNLPVYTISIQTDNKIIIGGDFTLYNNTLKNRIVRIDTLGVLDTSFNPDTGANELVQSAYAQNDGKIIIIGRFTKFNGILRKYIARLNSDGSLDTSFNPGTGANNFISTAATQSDGKVVIGGYFTAYNGISRSYVARLNVDGSLDTGFSNGTTNVNGVVNLCLIQNEGKIMIGGENVRRLNIDGSLDLSFNAYNNSISDFSIQLNGKIIVGNSSGSIVRLNSNGTVDSSFNDGSGLNGFIYTSSIQNDGKIIIGGSFTNYNGTPINRIARLNIDGSIDLTFNPGIGSNNTVLCTSIQNNGKIIIAGRFTSYNGSSRNYIARLNIDGTQDLSFNPGTGADVYITSTDIQNDDKIIISGDFNSYDGTGRNRVARINGDASLNTNNFDQNSVQIYPNPSKGFININFINLLENKQIDIYTILGQKIFSKTITCKETSIDISNHPKGVYIYNLYSNNSKIKTGKIVVE